MTAYQCFAMGQHSVLITDWLNTCNVLSGSVVTCLHWMEQNGVAEWRPNLLCAWNVLLRVNTGSPSIGVHLYGVKRLLSGLQQKVNAGIGWQQPCFQIPRQKSQLKSGFIVMEMWQVGSFEAPVMGLLQSEYPVCSCSWDTAQPHSLKQLNHVFKNHKCFSPA